MVISVKDNVARTGKVVWVIRNDDGNIRQRESCNAGGHVLRYRNVVDAEFMVTCLCEGRYVYTFEVL